MAKIQFARGSTTTMPTLKLGEPALATNINQAFIGTSSGNSLIGPCDISLLNGSSSNLLYSFKGAKTTIVYGPNNVNEGSSTVTSASSIIGGQFNRNRGNFNSLEGDSNIVGNYGTYRVLSVSGNSLGVPFYAPNNISNNPGYVLTSNYKVVPIGNFVSFSSGIGYTVTFTGTPPSNSIYLYLLGDYSNTFSHIEGLGNKVFSYHSHGEGWNNSIVSPYSSIKGRENVCSGLASSASGYLTAAAGDYSKSSGVGAIAKEYGSQAMGHYNIQATGSGTAYASASNALVIGNGTSDTARSNSFRVCNDGNVYCKGSFTGGGADYAEYFEWEDGNVDEEKRVGYFVYISNGEKISKCETGDEEILGIISANAGVVGNAASEVWEHMFMTDDFGAKLYDEITTTVPIDCDENGEPVETEEVVTKVLRLNPDYDPSQTYINRELRKEWDTVGLMGRLRVRDDGTCIINKKCKPTVDGVGTHSETEGYKVLKRISSNVIEILFK